MSIKNATFFLFVAIGLGQGELAIADEINSRNGPPPGVMAKVDRYRAHQNRLSADSDSVRGSDSAWSQGFYGEDGYVSGNQFIGCMTAAGGRPPRECIVIADDIININTD